MSARKLPHPLVRVADGRVMLTVPWGQIDDGGVTYQMPTREAHHLADQLIQAATEAALTESPD